MLAHKQIKFDERDFFKSPFTRDELSRLLARSRLTPRAVLSTQSPSFRALNVDADKLSDDQILEMMIREPRLIRRPLIVSGNESVIGFDKNKLTALRK